MYHTKKLIKNAFRITKTRGETALRIRVPGGHLEAKYLKTIQDLSEQFGNGTVHLTTRQGFEIPGIPMAAMAAVNKSIAEMISAMEKESGVVMAPGPAGVEPENGYPAAGTRNVSACIGNRVCRFANTDTTRLAKIIEGVIYPNDHHLKIAVTGCPNDCIKAHMNDIGIIANVIPEFDREQCILCEACLDNCREKITNALRRENHRIIKDDDYCLQCGECVLKCPTGAAHRGRQLYRIMIGGRTGKKNPRLADTVIQNASEAVVLEFCKNIYPFIDKHIDTRLPKEHLGYIIDRAGYDVFIRGVMESIHLNPEAEVKKPDNSGYFYKTRNIQN